ncbi:hypothetical protein STEG23_017146 [Scotinomys teguina]
MYQGDIRENSASIAIITADRCYNLYTHYGMAVFPFSLEDMLPCYFLKASSLDVKFVVDNIKLKGTGL